MKNKHLFVGVDIALNTTGFSILDETKKLYRTGLIETKKHWDYYKKIDFIYDSFVDLFNEIRKKNPKSVTLILEGRLKAGFSGQTLASIEGARVSSYLAYKHTCENYEIDVNHYVYNPNEVKYYFSKSRSASKEKMFKSVSSQFSSLKKLEFQEDIFDSIYLVLYHLESNHE